jgi:acyl dehydratase
MSTEARLLCSRYFDELAVGERFTTHGRTIGELDIVAFGALTGDCAPQHLDRRFGEAGPFGERIAHGALIVSYALGLVPIDPERLIALRALRDVTFKHPVRIGDTIHVEARIASCTAIDERTGLVALAARVLGDHGTLVARASIETLWRRAAGDALAVDASGSHAAGAAASNGRR